MRRLHGTKRAPAPPPLQPPIPATYHVNFPSKTRAACPAPVCPGTFTSRPGLRLHFMTRHPLDSICIRQEGSAPLPRCTRCDMHLPYTALNRRHFASGACRRGQLAKQRRLADTTNRTARTLAIKIHDIPLQTVQTFKYLGRTMAANNSDWQALYTNLAKARRKWATLTRILTKTGLPPRIAGLFYKAIAQAVLLYGSESWVITPAMLTTLEGFHHQVARRITNRMPRKTANNLWIYPPIKETLNMAGFFTMAEYIRRRQNTVADYIASRPLYDLCLGSDPAFPSYIPGQPTTTQSRLFRWWTQPLRTRPRSPLSTTTPTAINPVTALAPVKSGVIYNS